MTLEINKSLTQQMLRIQWDFYPDESDTQVLVLYNEFDRVVANIELGTNYSQIKYRYGKYLITKEQLDALGENLSEGLYLYKVTNKSSLECMCHPLAVGSLKVLVNCDDPSKEVSKPVEYNEDNSESEYITYNG